MDSDKKLVSWLRDAYAIEQQAETALRKYADASRDYPSLNAKLVEHAAETHKHKEWIESCLKALGQSHSGFESVVGRILGAGQTAASALLGDALLTNAAATYALEHLEVATYTASVAAAEKAGKEDVARICREILKEDSAMASWLLGQLPQLTQRYLGRSEGGH
jgi:ferritin-like metal-binding protein YciE